MSEVKWIKLSTQMFEDEKIRLIESMPEADTILIVWVKLLSQAGRSNNNGYIYLSENIPYTDEMLATIFNRPLSTVRMALEVFRNFGMIEVDGNQFISITNWEKHQNVAGLDKIREQNRIRKQRERDKKRLDSPEVKRDGEICQYCGNPATGVDHIIPISRGGKDVSSNKVPSCSRCNQTKMVQKVADFINGNQSFVRNEIILKNQTLMTHLNYDNKNKFFSSRDVTHSVTPSHATEQELELDLELEEDVVDVDSPGMAFRYYEENIGPLVSSVSETISIMISESSESLVKESLHRAVLANAGHKIKFADRILKNWSDKRIKTLADVKADDAAFERRKRGNSNGTTPKHSPGPDNEEYDGLSL